MSTTVNAAKKRPAGASTNATPVARAVPAKLAVTPALKARAHKFMEDNALIQPGEEIDIPGGFSNKWVLDKVIPQKDGSGFLVMRLRAFKNGRPQRETVESAEILACSKGATQISKFETVRPPTKATFKFGYPKDNDASTGPSDRYYVELDGASAANAQKAIVAKLTGNEGFLEGVAIKTGKAALDPTQGRTWQVVNAKYSIRGGMSAESLVLSIYPHDLDGDFDATLRGAAKEEVTFNGRRVTGASIQPWTMGHVEAQLKPANATATDDFR
jgi:hypothetical protein